MKNSPPPRSRRKNWGSPAPSFTARTPISSTAFSGIKTNLRTDKWGGDWKGRTEFACEIIRRSRKLVGPDFPLLIRLSQWKQQDFNVRAAENPAELEKWLAPLVEAGIDIFHCSQRRFWEPAFEDSDLNFAGWTKKLTGKPTISVGSVGLSGEFTAAYSGRSLKAREPRCAYRAYGEEEFDLIAVGRALLSDPEWVVKIRDGRTADLKDFTKDALATLY
ncbi:MAG: hypothetical protein R3C55_12125 [Parvularculaceae bacterium]